MIFRKIKKIRYYKKTEDYLIDYPREAIELDFNVDQNAPE